jgi:hypothetical protein
LNPNETTSINESGTNFVRQTVYSWYDKADRQTVLADYGSGASTWTNAAKPTRPNNTPANSTNTYGGIAAIAETGLAIEIAIATGGIRNPAGTGGAGTRMGGANTRTSGGTGPMGRRGTPIGNHPAQNPLNSSTIINGRTYTGHALDQTQNRGITPSVVENAINTGRRVSGKLPGTTEIIDNTNNISVVIDSETGRVITVKTISSK